MSWIPARAEGDTLFDQVFGLRPELFDAWSRFASMFWTEALVDPVLLELCRLRIAQLNGAAWPAARRMSEARDAGLTEERIGALDGWWKSDRFDAREKACLRFAEQFALDADGIADAEAAAVRAELGDPGMVAFVEALAIFDGFSRFCRLLEIEPDAPGLLAIEPDAPEEAAS